MAAPAVLRSSLHVLEPLDRLHDSFSAVVTVVSALESSPEGLCDRLRGSETWVNFGSMTTTLGSVNWPKNCCNDRPNAANGLSSGVSIFRACVMHTQKACSESMTYELIHTDVQTEKTLIHPIRTKPNDNNTANRTALSHGHANTHTPARASANRDPPPQAVAASLRARAWSAKAPPPTPAHHGQRSIHDRRERFPLQHET